MPTAGRCGWRTTNPCGEYLRPCLLELTECHDVLLEGPTFQNSPAWNLHPLLCDGVTIRNVKVLNPWWSQNGDGLDLDSCRNCLVADSHFDVGDDAICLKSGRDEAGRRLGRPSENITIRNCTVAHGHGGLVIGSEMSGGVRNVEVSHCVFNGTDVGLRFKTARGRGGVVENIRISNITMANIKNEAILFDMFYAVKQARPRTAQRADAAVPQLPHRQRHLPLGRPGDRHARTARDARSRPSPSRTPPSPPRPAYPYRTSKTSP